MSKERLDILLVQRGLCISREQAQALILAGEVWSKNTRLEKAGAKYPLDFALEIRSNTPIFSSRAGHKLEHALKAFSIVVKDQTCIDIGASTGGFTDCLLQSGASKVFAVDVGHGQLDHKLRGDPRVIVLEKTNARNLKTTHLVNLDPSATSISILVVDVSFISVLKVLEPLRKELPFCKDWIVLFKPQFEVGPEHLKKGGIVKDPAITKKALEDFDLSMKELCFTRAGAIETSPVPGKKSGNIEYLLHYQIKPQ